MRQRTSTESVSQRTATPQRSKDQTTAQRACVRTLGLVIVCVASMACGSSPTGPTPPTPTIPNIAGQWTGNYSVISCTESSPVGACAGIGGGGPHTLTPSQSGGNFTGQLGI